MIWLFFYNLLEVFSKSLNDNKMFLIEGKQELLLSD